MSDDLTVVDGYVPSVLPPLKAYLVSGFKGNLQVIPMVLANGILQTGVEHPSTEVRMDVGQNKLYLTFDLKAFHYHTREFLIACMENWKRYFEISIGDVRTADHARTVWLIVARVGEDRRAMFAWSFARLYPTQLERDNVTETMTVELVAGNGIQTDNGGNLTMLAQNLINNRAKAAQRQFPIS